MSYEGVIRRLVRSLGLNPRHADYDDALQEGRMRAWLAEPKFNGHGDRTQFVALCVRRHLAQWNRRRLTRTFAGSDAEPYAHEPDPAKEAERRDMAARMARIVADLPEPARTAFGALLAGGNQREAAWLVGLTSQAVSAAVRRHRRDFASLSDRPSDGRGKITIP